MECTVTYTLSNKALANSEVRRRMEQLEELIKQCDNDEIKEPVKDKGVPFRIFNSLVDYMKYYNESVNKSETPQEPANSYTEGVPFKLMKTIYEHMNPNQGEGQDHCTQDDIISAMHALGIKL